MAPGYASLYGVATHDFPNMFFFGNTQVRYLGSRYCLESCF